ncbi:nucleotide sugar dehydrogenase [Deferribacter autotrophicus]|uniref:Nucleotide sugar dehydrogenase n=1 Tax=Deferribacter autotrophicus TaxID=500465 RepID=A0A5A8F4E5_9BACT|nr:nucleotide sugar dehydrogenase [Deferribacter autotrophicus]KAA0259004.1 nucleotide sugar dehydrogenase [Deferribacter autotrophicus]
MRIAVVGLGYVGLPLAVSFAKEFDVIGFDIKKERIEELKNGKDSTGEVSSEELKNISIKYTANPEDLKNASFYIVTVPTPIDEHKNPDLTPLVKASETIGKYLKKGDYVVYESTVYPGVTEDICVPILEKESGLTFKKDFKVGYSPERINPGDKIHTFENIVKVVSGCDKESLDFIAEIYGKVVKAGIFKAESIKVAEAAKVIENTQRDLNIALMNELALIFDKMNIDTKSVLEAAGTKWNFLKFEPGLVGGHCIGVDPYYLTFKAQEIGYHPQIILSGRKINDYMGKFIAEKTVKLLIKANKLVKNAKVLILGFTFKENVPDIRNTKVIDIYSELIEYGVNPYIFDPIASTDEIRDEYNIETISSLDEKSPYDGIILAVKHDYFIQNLDNNLIKKLISKNGVFIDVKGIMKNKLEKIDITYWRL